MVVRHMGRPHSPASPPRRLQPQPDTTERAHKPNDAKPPPSPTEMAPSGHPPDIYNQSILNNSIATRPQVPIATNMLPPCSLPKAAELPPHDRTFHIHPYWTERHQHAIRRVPRQTGLLPTCPPEQNIPPKRLQSLNTIKKHHYEDGTLPHCRNHRC